MSEQVENENIEVVVKEECIDLQNLKYKKMLMTGVPMKETKYSSNLLMLDDFLENEKNNNENEPWCKLNKTTKHKKLLDFVEVYKSQHNMDEEETNILTTFFKDCLERKKLQKVKDVVYDRTSGNIKNIPSLVYTKNTKHFTLKNVEKKVSTSTLKNLVVKNI
jgi:hypothetical protein